MMPDPNVEPFPGEKELCSPHPRFLQMGTSLRRDQEMNANEIYQQVKMRMPSILESVLNKLQASMRYKSVSKLGSGYFIISSKRASQSIHLAKSSS